MQTMFVIVFPMMLAGALACSSESVSMTNPDAAASVGCRHFSNVALDARKGVLSDAEIVVKVREVYDDMKVSEVHRLSQKALDVVNDASSGDASAFGKSSSVLASTCQTILENS